MDWYGSLSREEWGNMGEIKYIVESENVDNKNLEAILRILPKPRIIRRGVYRVEILLPKGLPRNLSLPEGWRVRTVDEDDFEASLEEFRRLIYGERFYEAHIMAEAIMRGGMPRLGRCLALYSAMLVKIAENLPNAVYHLLREMEGCEQYIDLECTERLASRYTGLGVRPDGETLVCLKPI